MGMLRLFDYGKEDFGSLTFHMDVRWTLKLLLIFAFWNNVHAQGPLEVYRGNAQFVCPKDSNDWFTFGGYCHSVVYNASSQRDAARLCATRNGVLLSVNDSMETLEMSWHLNQLLINPIDPNARALVWTAYEIISTNSPNCRFSKQLSTNRQKTMPIYTSLWSNGEPRLDPDLTCVALDVSVTDTNRYGWHTIDCQTNLPFVCSFLACQKDEFRCRDNSKCINQTWTCDGVEDCPDSSDETGCQVECGVLYHTNLTGSITSPNYPKHYPDDALCVWQILLPKQYKIQLKFDHFDTERFHDVLYAKEGFWEEAQDWDSLPDTLLFNKSGPLSTEKISYKTATNSILLKFVSDESITRPGFLITWEADDSIKNCVPEEPLTATPLERELSSPGYQTGQYPCNVMCEWVIQSQDPNSVVSLQFVDFALAKTDWVQVFDKIPSTDKSVRDSLIDSYTADHPPYVITSRYNSLKIVFFSDPTRVARGFSLIYKSGCSGLGINATYAYFSSSDASGHLEGQSCGWRLYHPSGKKITVVLENVSLFGNDSIKISYGWGEVTYRNGSTIVPVSSTNGVINVQFSSSSAFSGFDASFSEDCPSLPSIQHGNISTTDTYYGVLVEFICERGFTLQSNTNPNMTCGPNGNWSGNVPRCEPVACSAPPRMTDGVLQAILAPCIPDKCTANYACNPGSIKSSAQLRCTIDGTWIPLGNVCQPVTCNAPPEPPPHAQYTEPPNSTYFLNDAVQYKCQPPYKADQPGFAVCTESGAWLKPNFTCQQPVCRSPKVIFGHLPDSHMQHGMTTLRKVQCMPGFRQETSIFGCVNETWSPDVICDDVDECAASNGSACESGTCRNVKGSWICTCARGWFWNEATKGCEDINECREFNHECDEDYLCTNTLGGYICSCLPGYTLFDGQNAPPIANTTYLRVSRSCVPVRCPDPVYNGSVIRVTTNDSFYIYNTEITFQCKWPFVQAPGTGLIRAVCQANGHWSALAPKCVEASCPLPRAIAKGFYAPNFDHKEMIAPGTVIEYFCDDTHVLQGPKRRVCLGGRLKWTGMDPVCKSLQCPELDPPEGGFVTYEKERNSGAIARFYCDPFHHLVGSESMRCADDGCWRGNRPMCQALSCNLTSLPDLLAPQDPAATKVHAGRVVQFQCLIPGLVVSDRRPLACSVKTELPIFPGLEMESHRIRRSVRSSFLDTVHVCKDLTITKITSDAYVEEGEPIELTCAIDADCSGFQITWEKGASFGLLGSEDPAGQDDRITFVQTGTKTYTMQIQKAERGDSGYYWCKVWYHNEVRSQKRVLLLVSTPNDEFGRKRRQSVPADKLPPELVYLYDSNTNNETEWTFLNGLNETQASFANANSFRLCHTHLENNSWLRSPLFPANEHSVTAEVELVTLWPFCGQGPCVRLGILGRDAEGMEMRNDNGYHVLDHMVEPMDLEEVTRQRRRRVIKMKASLETRGEFHLAITNYGLSCVEIRRISLYFLACPEFQKGLTRFPRTFAPSHISDKHPTVVSGHCVQGAEDILPLTNVECRANGRWGMDPLGGSCTCRKGYMRMQGVCVKRGPLCYACQDADSMAQCNRRSRLQQCRADEVCTTILSVDPSFKLTKGCAKANQCQNRVDNFTSCLRGQETCQMCCGNDYCNVVPFLPSEPQWNSTFPTCIDAEPPRFLNCSHTNVTVLLDFDGSPVVIEEGEEDGIPFPLPVATDNSGQVMVTLHPQELWSKALYENGSARVTLTAKDPSNLTATCSFFVHSASFLQPRLNCPQKAIEDTIGYLEHSQRNIPTRYPPFNFTDGRRVVRRVYDPPQGTLIEIGRPVTVKMTAFDESGTGATCTFTYVIKALGCPNWTLPGFETLTSLPQCLPGFSTKTEDTVPVVCTFSSQNCTNGLWVPADGPFTFVCNGSGQWRPTGEDIPVNFLPTCAPFYVPSVSFTLEVNYTLLDESSASDDCLNQYSQFVLAEGIRIMNQSCGETTDARIAWNVSSERKEGGVSIRLNFTLSSPKSLPQSNILVQCLERYLTELGRGETFGVQSNVCPNMTAQVSLTDQLVETCPNGHVKRLGKNGPENGLDYLCVKCPPGTFTDSTKSICSPCPMGAYQSRWGRDSCHSCPIDTSTLHTYGRSVKDCFSFCPPGHFSETGLQPCHACPQGFYQSNTRNFNCIRCPNGTSTLAHGSVDVEDCKSFCKPGTFGDGGVEPCYLCPIGYIQPNGQSRDCLKCPTGKTTRNVGSIDLAECIDSAPCSSDQCANGGTCLDISPENKCVCRPGTIGKHCRRRLNVCTNTSCANGGICQADNGKLKCNCPEGFTGKYCERTTNQSRISSSSTENHAISAALCANKQCGQCQCEGSSSVLCHWNTSFDPCGCNPCSMCSSESTLSCSLNTSSPRIFSCSCKIGWSGRYCDRMSDSVCPGGECTSPKPCLATWFGRNGSTCLRNAEECPCQNGAFCRRDGDHCTCDCRNHYFGPMCQRFHDPCLQTPCQHNGTCYANASDPAQFLCNCPSGWTGDRCEEEKDFCSPNPCQNGGTCHGRFDGFQCTCNFDWTGSKCETRLHPCLTYDCYSGGTCKVDDTSSQKPYCVCQEPWTGLHCETFACSDPRMCPANETCVQTLNNGTCRDRPSSQCQSMFCDNGGTCRQNDTYGYTCDCPPGYSGDTCSVEVDVCEHSMCQNNATCKRSAKGGYLCFCQLGFYGTYCESTISGCDQNPCHNGGTCTDVGNGILCICTSLYTGQFCDKAKSQNFNMFFAGREALKNMSWIVTSEFTLTEKMNSITLCFWVRFSQDETETPRQMTYLTVAKVKRNKDRPAEINLLPVIQFTETGLILNSPGSKDRKLQMDLPVNDSAWHSVCFDWHWSSAEWILYIDGKTFKTNVQDGYERDSFDATTITQGPYMMVLGQSADKQRLFYGELSMVTLVSAFDFTSTQITQFHSNCENLLNGEDIASKASSVVRWIDFTQPDPGDVSVVLTYPSVCSPSYCLPEQKTCKLDRIPPEVRFCPKDRAIYSPTRLQAATWPQPQFADNVEIVQVTSNFRSGQLLPWGEYQIVYTAQDRAGNTAVCKFRLYITPFKCENLIGPTNTTNIDCQKFSQGLACSLNCSANHYFTQVVRPFYACGIEGAYDPLRPDVPVIVPACAPAANMGHDDRLLTTVQARLATDHIIDCTDEANLTLIRNKVIERLENTYQLQIALCNGQKCNFSNAVRLRCSIGSIPKRRKRGATLLDLDDRNQTMDIDDDDGVPDPHLDFSFSWQTSNSSQMTEMLARVLRSVPLVRVSAVSSRITCPVGSTFMDEICVPCSIGTFYDVSTETCWPCPLNTYNNQIGRSECTPCPQGKITASVGGQRVTDCIDNCTAGYYFNFTTRICTPCEIGLYQQKSGAASCDSCNPGQTTLQTGSTSVIDCIFLCGPGVELDWTGLACVPCPRGTYKGALNDSGCTSCPMDYTTTTTASTSQGNCTVLYCSPGKYRKGNQCLVCPIGMYQDGWDQPSCKNCPNNQVTQFQQSGNIKDCHSGGCVNLCDLCPQSNATCTFNHCQTRCECKPGYKRIDNQSNICIDKCDLECKKGERCIHSNESEPVCSAPVDNDVKVISITVGAASGGFVAIVLIITLVVIFKVRLYHLVRCCKGQSLKEISSHQYYRSSTYPAISQVQTGGRRRSSDSSANTNRRMMASGLQSPNSISYNPAAECFDMQDIRPPYTKNGRDNGNEKSEFDKMTPSEVYSAIYEGLQGIRSDQALSDYLTSASQSTAVFENRAFDFDDEPPSPPPYPYPDDLGTPEFGRARFRPPAESHSDEDDYFS